MAHQNLAETLALHLAGIIQRVDGRIPIEHIGEETIVPNEALNRFADYVRSQKIRRERPVFPANCTVAGAIELVCRN